MNRSKLHSLICWPIPGKLQNLAEFLLLLLQENKSENRVKHLPNKTGFSAHRSAIYLAKSSFISIHPTTAFTSMC